MTTRLSRERALTSALDHLHTPGPALARFASNGAVDDAPASNDHTSSASARTRPAGAGPRRRRTSQPPRWRLAVTLCAVLFAGFSGATFAGSAPAVDTAPVPNSVLTFGAARALGSAANLDLREGIVAIASDPVGPGYWLAASDGGVFAFGRASFFGSTGSTQLSAPMVGIAATPKGRGYWLVGADGGVFAFGDARYHGSLGGTRLASAIVEIVPTETGHGYWLVGADGGVFAFGDARFFGSARRLHLSSPIVGAAATRTGDGYWLLGSDGGVFSFGDAHFAGSRPDASQPAVGIAAARKGRGYWVARADGSVLGFDALPRGNDAVFKSEPGTAKTVAIAASFTGGYWIAQGELDPSTVTPDLSADPFLACTRAHESDSSGGYQAISAGGTYRGAYQFDRSTWNSAANLARRPDLVGVDPAAAAPADQDLLALALYHARGTQPWGGRCAGLS
jgi:hypothetical protein